MVPHGGTVPHGATWCQDDENPYSYGHELVITGYKWDCTFDKWAYKYTVYLQLVFRAMTVARIEITKFRISHPPGKDDDIPQSYPKKIAQYLGNPIHDGGIVSIIDHQSHVT